jgi:hypothetical protein
MVMKERTLFQIGVEASCIDGACGEVSRVVIDPVARTLTHLVVEPKHGDGRLVPLSLVEATTGEVLLGCTMAEFDKLDAAEETHFVPGGTSYPGLPNLELQRVTSCAESRSETQRQPKGLR